jgi:dipeptidyl aminopeptidase/acylaminoacyl peptidase
MKNKIFTTVLLLFGAGFLYSQKKPTDFTITGKVRINTPYNQQTDFYKWYYDSSFYEKARQTGDFECIKIIYKSDTASVEAWLYKPVQIANKKLPVIIYNRGGMGNFGNLEETNLVDFFKMAEAGYSVIASKTRFCGINGKYDQHGGIDINDIVNLQNIYTNLPYADTANVFMYGYSRGGQNCYQASLRMRLNAMATTAGTADWLERMESRTEFADGWTDEDSTQNFLGFRKTIPGWATDSIQALIDRSAVYWAYKINTPVLIMHSRQDPKVLCSGSLKLAEQLQRFGKEYSLIIYDEPSHSLPFKFFYSYDQMFKWFEKHKHTHSKQ